MSQKPSDQQVVTALCYAAQAIVETAKDCGPTGAPSGVMYVALLEYGMTFDLYTEIINTLVDFKHIRVENDCVIAL